LKGHLAPYHTWKPSLKEAQDAFRTFLVFNESAARSGDVVTIEWPNLVHTVALHYRRNSDAVENAIKQKARNQGHVASIAGQKVPKQRDVVEVLYETTAWDVMHHTALSVGRPIAFWEWGCMVVGNIEEAREMCGDVPFLKVPVEVVVS
jgi:hypothetical protein